MKIKRKNLYATLAKFDYPMMKEVAESYFPNLYKTGKIKFKRKNVLKTIERHGSLPGLIELAESMFPNLYSEGKLKIDLYNTIESINKYPEMKEFYFTLIPKLKKFADELEDCSDSCSCCGNDCCNDNDNLDEYTDDIEKFYIGDVLIDENGDKYKLTEWCGEWFLIDMSDGEIIHAETKEESYWVPADHWVFEGMKVEELESEIDETDEIKESNEETQEETQEEPISQESKICCNCGIPAPTSEETTEKSE
jgi:hypothetical protein